MSTGHGHLKSRLHLFNDDGMPEQLRKNLYWVIWSVTIGMIGFVITAGPVWSAFQREILGANDLQLGLISAIPVSTCALQVFISYYMEKKRNRRFLFLFLGLAGRSLWILIALVPYIFPSFSVDLRIWLVIVFVVIISGSNSGMNLAYGSLMGDLVPLRIRGSYFAIRQRISLISGVITGLLISTMIDRVGLAGYTIALAIAGITLVLDVACYLFVKWPEMDETHLPPLRALLKEVFSNKRFVKIVIFYSMWLFTINIAAPFWNIHMLEYLRMSFTQMALYSQIISGIASILIIARWGRLIDPLRQQTRAADGGDMHRTFPATVAVRHALHGLYYTDFQRDLGRDLAGNRYLPANPLFIAIAEDAPFHVHRRVLCLHQPVRCRARQRGRRIPDANAVCVSHCPFPCRSRTGLFQNALDDHDNHPFENRRACHLPAENQRGRRANAFRNRKKHRKRYVGSTAPPRLFRAYIDHPQAVSPAAGKGIRRDR